jgi:tetratricopeptide (TPR) repeat protein
MYFRKGDYKEALALLSEAENRLESVRSNLSYQGYQDELARLRAAFALVYMDLAEYARAETSAHAAATIHEKISDQDVERLLQAAISYTHLGNARREQARLQEATFVATFRAYDYALQLLHDELLQGVVAASEDQGLEEDANDRESDVYLQRGRTLLLDGRPEPALEDLQKALSLTSERQKREKEGLLAGLGPVHLKEAYSPE